MPDWLESLLEALGKQYYVPNADKVRDWFLKSPVFVANSIHRAHIWGHSGVRSCFGLEVVADYYTVRRVGVAILRKRFDSCN